MLHSYVIFWGKLMPDHDQATVVLGRRTRKGLNPCTFAGLILGWGPYRPLGFGQGQGCRHVEPARLKGKGLGSGFRASWSAHPTLLAGPGELWGPVPKPQTLAGLICSLLREKATLESRRDQGWNHGRLRGGGGVSKEGTGDG